MERLVACLLGVWLLCGAISAFIVIDKRPLTGADYLFGPISLAENWR